LDRFIRYWFLFKFEHGN